MSQADTPDFIEQALRAKLTVHSLHIEDDSHEHAGHQAAGAGGHYTVAIVADEFEGKRSVARHRLVYDALGPLMQTRIHALAIDAKGPSEV
ncbi:BolA family protein [Derxia gummosa]|uniref:BolA family protein n=1 Tax=Derxia gummosa DSM 723 TaxID=1121388 RepID=A0A8B6X399_9BURK|nr:BolA family protein [Derxia gummosa]